MTIAIESFDYAVAGGITSTGVTINKPTGVVSGDLLLLLVCNGNNTDTDNMNTPSGWVKQFEEGSSGADAYVAAFTKIATGSEAASETVTWITSTQPATGWYLRISGAHATTYWDSVGSTVDTDLSAMVIPAITPTVDDCMVFSLGAADGNATAFAPSGTNWSSSFPANQEQYDGTPPSHQNCLGGWVTQLQTTAGTSNDCTFTKTGSDGSFGIQFAIAPAVVASAAISSVGGDDVVLDAELNAAFITTGFASEISTVQLVSGTSITNATGVTSTSGTGDFDLPDITGYVVDTVGCPLTTTNNVVVARLTDA